MWSVSARILPSANLSSPIFQSKSFHFASKSHRRLTSGPVHFSLKEFEAPAGKLKKKFFQVFSFKGRAPEIVNGRLAMLGFACGVSVEVSEGQSIISQVFNGGLNWLCFTCLVFTVASVVPILKGFSYSGDLYEDAVYAELLNGRLAMIGFISLVLLEYRFDIALFA